ncbi:MAG: hypothetical protein ACR2KI_05080 [Candidatus Limnocylindria bacterium]
MARPGSRRASFGTRSATWSAGKEALFVASATGLERLDLFTGAATPIVAPSGMSPKDVVGVSPQGRWLAAFDAGSSRLTFAEPGASGSGFAVAVRSQSVPSLGWSPDERFALVFTGPPVAAAVIRLSGD